MKYYYGMRLRGYSPMCQPSGVVEVQDDETGKYHDVIAYDHKLSKHEVLAYELDFIKAE